MDPAFLRGARHDADGSPPESPAEPSALWVRLQAVVQQVVAKIRHH